jgi:hypothetical protein
LETGDYGPLNLKVKGVWTSLPGAAQQTNNQSEFAKLFQNNISKELNGKSNIALTNQEVEQVLTKLNNQTQPK